MSFETLFFSSNSSCKEANSSTFDNKYDISWSHLLSFWNGCVVLWFPMHWTGCKYSSTHPTVPLQTLHLRQQCRQYSLGNRQYTVRFFILAWQKSSATWTRCSQWSEIHLSSWIVTGEGDRSSDEDVHPAFRLYLVCGFLELGERIDSIRIGHNGGRFIMVQEKEEKGESLKMLPYEKLKGGSCLV